MPRAVKFDRYGGIDVMRLRRVTGYLGGPGDDLIGQILGHDDRV